MRRESDARRSSEAVIIEGNHPIQWIHALSRSETYTQTYKILHTLCVTHVGYIVSPTDELSHFF